MLIPIRCFSCGKPIGKLWNKYKLLSKILNEEEVFEKYRLYTGKVINQGIRRGDFVRVIYNLWGGNTQLLHSDSSFVEGTQVIYRSGIVTDTVLEPNQSAQFKVLISIPDSITVTYITRDVHWALFD